MWPVEGEINLKYQFNSDKNGILFVKSKHLLVVRISEIDSISLSDLNGNIPVGRRAGDFTCRPTHEPDSGSTYLLRTWNRLELVLPMVISILHVLSLSDLFAHYHRQWQLDKLDLQQSNCMVPVPFDPYVLSKMKFFPISSNFQNSDVDKDLSSVNLA